MDEATDTLIREAAKLLEAILACDNQLRRSWSEGHWRKMDRLVWRFCHASQVLHMSLGGFNRTAFDRALKALNKFDHCVTDLLETADAKGHGAPKAIRQRIVGVVERSRKRAASIRAKRRDIAKFRKAEGIVLSDRPIRIPSEASLPVNPR